MEKILVIDDEKSLLDLLTVVFRKEGYAVETALSAPRAFELIDKNDFDLILADIRLPRASGMDILKRMKEGKPEIPVVMMTAYGTIKQAVEALKMGASDYIVKPFDVDELKIIVSQGLEKKKLREENIFLKKKLRDSERVGDLIGKSKEMQRIYSLIERIAGTDSTVLISGESGTGKEIAARAVHHLSHRCEKPFVSLNCGALPESLLESELFGHMKGSFTGAIATKKGMFEAAEKGTLFLDEIGEMSPATQVKLLRALQERKIRRVGGTGELPVDVRIIAATNQDMKKNIKEGSFREDLFYRLNVISFEMPPLRKRKEDIALFVSHFLEKYCRRMGRRLKRVAPEVVGAFEAYPWPGNIRELENVIERIVAVEERETITKQSLPEELLALHERPETGFLIQPGFSLNDTLDTISRTYVEQALKLSDGNLKEAASLLGVNYRSIRYLAGKFGVKKGREGSRVGALENEGEGALKGNSRDE